MVEQPTQEEIEKVAHYWQWVKDMACEHREWTMIADEVTCSFCQRPLSVMSDVQLEAATNKKEVSRG